ncbi:unnamed protein product [Ectocarpus sp. 8 AP-2014]
MTAAAGVLCRPAWRKTLALVPPRTTIIVNRESCVRFTLRCMATTTLRRLTTGRHANREDKVGRTTLVRKASFGPAWSVLTLEDAVVLRYLLVQGQFRRAATHLSLRCEGRGRIISITTSAVEGWDRARHSDGVRCF